MHNRNLVLIVAFVVFNDPGVGRLVLKVVTAVV